MHADHHLNTGTRNGSIRGHLERDAWAHHPELLGQRWVRRRARDIWRENGARGEASHDNARRSLRWQDRTLLCLAVALMLTLLLRIETAGADDWGLELRPAATQTTANADDPATATVQLAMDTVIHVEVTGLLARVHVAQTFRNDSSAWAEGSYRFPLPDGAAVDRLWISVGDQVLEGEIHEREEATRVYQAARREGRAAGLVAQERQNQFRTRLANIAPGEDIHVVIAYLANVSYADGRFNLRLPMTFNRRFGAEAQPGTGRTAPRPEMVSLNAAPEQPLKLQVDLLTDLDIGTIRSHHHDVSIDPAERGYRVTLADGLEHPDRAFELSWAPTLLDQPQSSLQTWDDGRDVYAQLMLVPPLEGALQSMPREVIFIIDTSGSMQGASMEQAKSALQRGVDGLEPGDHFNVIEFNSDTRLLWEASVPASAGSRDQAFRMIADLDANGGTVMAPALLAALGQPVSSHPGGIGVAATNVGDLRQPELLRQVVFITDGAVGNERELLAMVADHLDDARLFTVSIGAAPNNWFMRKAAEIGRGRHTRIGRVADVEERMSALWSSIRLPAVSDICLDWGIEAEYYPEVIPDLYAGEPLWVVARLPEPPDAVHLCGELNGAPWAHDALPMITDGSETLATLWARRKVEALQDGLVVGADPATTREAVTQVALEHSLLTPYTSLVAVDKTPRRPDGTAMATGNVPSLLPAGSTSNTVGFPTTATGWKTQLVLSLLVLAISGGLFARPFFRPPAWSSLRSPAFLSLRALVLKWREN